MAVCAPVRKKPWQRAVRAWVLTFPFPLRFLLAAQPEALTQVLAVVQRGISTFVIHRSGLTVSSGAQTGAVTLIQRCGSALNLNPHLHMLFLDGAYAFRCKRAVFHRARRPTGDELTRLLDRLSRRIVRVLQRRGLLIADPEHPSLDWVPDSSLDHLQAASVSYRIAIGPHAGRTGPAPAPQPHPLSQRRRERPHVLCIAEAVREQSRRACVRAQL